MQQSFQVFRRKLFVPFGGSLGNEFEIKNTKFVFFKKNVYLCALIVYQ